VQGEKLVISQGSTWDITGDLLANDSSQTGALHVATNGLFDSGHHASSTAYVYNADGSAATGYSVSEDTSGLLTLTVARNVVAGGNANAPEVLFVFLLSVAFCNSGIATATIKTVNVTGGNNSLDLAASGVGIYNFSHIDGTKGSDSFVGTDANDTFSGAAGADTLSGAGGADTFRFSDVADSQPGNFDTITDFVHGIDKIDLSLIAGLTQVQASAILPQTIAAHTIQIVATGGNTIVYANTTSNSQTIAAADMEIHLTGLTNLSASDIWHS
jgi:Ca2+-binding RTX toxin-like protein